MKLFTQLTLSLAVIFCITSMVSAQTVNKGAWMAGGSASFSSEKYKDADDSYTIVEINPNAAYYFMNDFAVGLAVDFFNSSYDGTSTSSTFLGPYLRYYVTNPLFVAVYSEFGLSEGSGSSFAAGVGYSWFLNNSVAIEPQLFYRSFNNEGDVNDFSEFGLSIGVQAFLGRTSGE